MPFKSEAQRRFMHANHPEIAERWEREAGSVSNPAHMSTNGGHYTPDPIKEASRKRRKVLDRLAKVK